MGFCPVIEKINAQVFFSFSIQLSASEKQRPKKTPFCVKVRITRTKGHRVYFFPQVIAAEGEQKASRALREASEVISESPSALQVSNKFREQK